MRLATRFQLIAIALIAGSSIGAVCGGSDGSAPTIVAQPLAQKVSPGANATFSVAAEGAAPLAYQWRRNGTDISAATAASYTAAAVATADSGALFSVVVSNSLGSVTSADALLTVAASVDGGSGPGTLRVHNTTWYGGTGAQLVAFQDGSAPWRSEPFAPSGDYSFTVTDGEGRYGVALAEVGVGNAAAGLGYILHGTLGEISDVNLPFGGNSPPDWVPINVTVAELAAGVLNVGLMMGGHTDFHINPYPPGLGVGSLPVGTYDALLSVSDANRVIHYALFLQGFTVRGAGTPIDVNLTAMVLDTSGTATVTVDNGTPGQSAGFDAGLALRGDREGEFYSFGSPQRSGKVDASGVATGTVAYLASPVSLVKAYEGGMLPTQREITTYFAGRTDHMMLSLPPKLVATAASLLSGTNPRPSFTIVPTAGTQIYEYTLSGKAKDGSALGWTDDTTAGWIGAGSSARLDFPDFSTADGWNPAQPKLAFIDGAYIGWTLEGTSFNNDVKATLIEVQAAPNTQPGRKAGDVKTHQVFNPPPSLFICPHC